ncbi:hypothetical protein [Bradyrhizobium vignae]|uniref:DUF1835 domain-containing protein n=1 Tax=Bradyrhizobium vignae TaxID=1549949 RepID=A0A2U3PZ46_9BRAD|nr:hypothetical protein [Bradyrhizobium vignae]SPP94386.1 conserved protein of unknown function [Bradyrhizobium vignae]
MTRRIVTTDSSIAGAIQRAGIAGLVIAIERRLVWGQLPSDAELDAFFAPRTTQSHGLHWLDDTPPWRLEESGAKDRGFIELLGEYDSVEFWRGPGPNGQLILLWLLDHWCRRRDANPAFVVRALFLGVGDVDPPRRESYPPVVRITPLQLKSASRAWRAYCAPTPQSWCNLTNLSWLPNLAPDRTALLEELPRPASGLGATELRILQLIARGGLQPFDVFPGHHKRNERRVFDYWEVGALLDGLARCPVPAVSGLEEGAVYARHAQRCCPSRPVQAIPPVTYGSRECGAGRRGGFPPAQPDPSLVGGTELTNEKLWRWDPETRSLIAPR